VTGNRFLCESFHECLDLGGVLLTVFGRTLAGVIACLRVHEPGSTANRACSDLVRSDHTCFFLEGAGDVQFFYQSCCPLVPQLFSFADALSRLSVCA